jgi:phosphoesterase RecJ-like protein
MKKEPIDLISKKILDSQRIVITSHLRPDGDSICTGLALYFIGELLGKEMAYINQDVTPFPFNHLPEIDKIQIGQIPSQTYDLVILLECASVVRSGQKNIDDYFKANIDHHHSNYYYADINWVDPEASAVAEMVYFLGKKLKIDFTPQIASLLYCAIISDTGSFRFSNTSARSFDVCYRLIKHGANPVEVSERLFNNNSPEKIKLLGQVISTLQMNEKGNIAIITMSKKHLNSLNLREIDTEDITTLARSIKGVEMVLFFKEIREDTFRVSLRSRGRANAAAIAEYFGGGGHFHAAGFPAQGKYEKLAKEIPEAVEKFLDRQSRE